MRWNFENVYFSFEKGRQCKSVCYTVTVTCYSSLVTRMATVHPCLQKNHVNAAIDRTDTYAQTILTPLRLSVGDVLLCTTTSRLFVVALDSLSHANFPCFHLHPGLRACGRLFPRSIEEDASPRYLQSNEYHLVGRVSPTSSSARRSDHMASPILESDANRPMWQSTMPMLLEDSIVANEVFLPFGPIHVVPDTNQPSTVSASLSFPTLSKNDNGERDTSVIVYQRDVVVANSKASSTASARYTVLSSTPTTWILRADTKGGFTFDFTLVRVFDASSSLSPALPGNQTNISLRSDAPTFLPPSTYGSPQASILPFVDKRESPASLLVQQTLGLVRTALLGVRHAEAIASRLIKESAMSDDIDSGYTSAPATPPHIYCTSDTLESETGVYTNEQPAPAVVLSSSAVCDDNSQNSTKQRQFLSDLLQQAGISLADYTPKAFDEATLLRWIHPYPFLPTTFPVHLDDDLPDKV